MSKKKTITVDGVEYIRADSVKQAAVELDGMEYVIIRSYDAGVHAGYLESRKGEAHRDEVILVNTRRLWYWDGAASLSQLARDGVSKPDNCKFSVELEKNTILGAIEIIPCTEVARLSIKGVPEWIN